MKYHYQHFPLEVPLPVSKKDAYFHQGALTPRKMWLQTSGSRGNDTQKQLQSNKITIILFYFETKSSPISKIKEPFKNANSEIQKLSLLNIHYADHCSLFFRYYIEKAEG